MPICNTTISQNPGDTQEIKGPWRLQLLRNPSVRTSCRACNRVVPCLAERAKPLRRTATVAMKAAATLCITFALLVAAGDLPSLPYPPMPARCWTSLTTLVHTYVEGDGVPCSQQVLWCTGAQEHVGRKFLSAPAPGPMPQHAGAARDPKAADLLFVLSADQVSGKGPFRDGAARCAHCVCS